jgi:hypothetical protein
MHGTIGTVTSGGIRLHNLPDEKRPVRRVLAAIGFFLLTFGSASIGMGAAIALSGASSGTSAPALNAADMAARNNDGYLEEYARGPGRGWFVLGQAPCFAENNCARKVPTSKVLGVRQPHLD